MFEVAQAFSRHPVGREVGQHGAAGVSERAV